MTELQAAEIIKMLTVIALCLGASGVSLVFIAAAVLDFTQRKAK